MTKKIDDLTTKSEMLERYFEISQSHFRIGNSDELKDIPYKLKVSILNEHFFNLRLLEKRINETKG